MFGSSQRHGHRIDLEDAMFDPLETPCQSLGEEPCSACSDVEDLNQQIKAIQTTLTKLFHERSEAGTLFNAKHPSMIHRMPLEVTSNVFEHYAQHSSPLTLGAVCKDWRQVAWSAPRLWTLFVVHADRVNTDDMVEIGKEWLGRSGCLPLSVYFPRTEGPLDHVHLGKLIEAVNQHSGRWQSLDLNLPPSTLRLFRETGGSPTTLTNLALRATIASEPVEVNVTKCSPRTASIKFLPWNALPFRRDTLTTIAADGLSVDEVFHVLQQAPLLQNASFEYVIHDPDAASSTDPGLRSAATHPLLQGLYIGFDGHVDIVTMGSFFDWINLPALTSLSVSAYDVELPVPPLASFLTRSSCCLEELALMNCSVSDDGLLDLVKRTPSLKRLDVSACFEQPVLQSFFTNLNRPSSTTTTRDPGHRSILLPKLESFSWTGGPVFRWDLLLELLAPDHHEGNYFFRRPLKQIQVFCDRFIDDEDQDPTPYIDEQTLSRLECAQLATGVSYDFAVAISMDPPIRADLLSMSFDRMHFNHTYDDIWGAYERLRIV
ncbi:hypothetical protein CVT26_010071 [Gymnopilus dilepis]|uniref:Uncharacterized protein n=1 Tax=Gymnopilus dilepis TaxID=231916 RepID=A0A409VWM1_9AGAR|nr:hypothetical protein CVT26_010071 [Gymnopilus dilepis]